MKAVEMLESFFKSKLDNRGRMYIPKEAREKLSIKGGDKIYLRIENDHFIAYTAKAINTSKSAMDKTLKKSSNKNR